MRSLLLRPRKITAVRNWCRCASSHVPCPKTGCPVVGLTWLQIRPPRLYQVAVVAAAAAAAAAVVGVVGAVGVGDVVDVGGADGAGAFGAEDAGGAYVAARPCPY